LRISPHPDDRSIFHPNLRLPSPLPRTQIPLHFPVIEVLDSGCYELRHSPQKGLPVPPLSNRTLSIPFSSTAILNIPKFITFLSFGFSFLQPYLRPNPCFFSLAPFPLLTFFLRHEIFHPFFFSVSVPPHFTNFFDPAWKPILVTLFSVGLGTPL